MRRVMTRQHGGMHDRAGKKAPEHKRLVARWQEDARGYCLIVEMRTEVEVGFMSARHLPDGLTVTPRSPEAFGHLPADRIAAYDTAHSHASAEDVRRGSSGRSEQSFVPLPMCHLAQRGRGIVVFRDAVRSTGQGLRGRPA